MKDFIGKEAKDVSPSPFGRWINGKMIAMERGKTECEILIRPEFANPGGILHGGAISGIFDEVMGVTTFTLANDGFYVAINLNVDFLKPGIVGETVLVKTEVIREGRNMIHAESRMYNANGALLAKASSNLALTQIHKK